MAPHTLLKLNLNDLLDTSTSTNILKVLGDSGDTVTISDFVKAAGITKTEGSITYDVYTHGYANTNAKAALWIQQGISVNDLPPVIDLDPMEVSNRSFRLSFKVLLPEPLISIISIS
jgi:hypothetical protein